MTKSDNIIFRIAEAILLSVIAYFYSVAQLNLPFALFSAIIIGVIAYRKTFLATALDSAAVLAALVLLGIKDMYIDFLKIAISFFNLAVIGAVAGIVLKHKKSFPIQISAVMLAELFTALLAILYVKRTSDDVFDMFFGNVANVYSAALTEALRQSGMYTADMAGTVSDFVNVFCEALKMFTPSLLIICSVVAAYFKFIVIKKAIELFERKKLCVTAFSNLRFGNKLTFASMIVVLLLLMMQKSIVSDALSNILIIMFFAHFVCGMSVLDFYFKKTKIFWWLRLAIYVLAVVFSSAAAAFIIPAIAIIGVVDSRVNIRKINSVEDVFSSDNGEGTEK